ncbi:helix-turn-helix domain-containing protein [Pontibacter sp. HSC-36F09]|uniref:helix-turn-helix domain-containing protein n=1 Tax=Pontibacter sp. HSC-36F09 TaxID=2910966 RepID=UPI00209D4021|nr:helix-turn-helix domain-containing protein [Pontibacter sp. HSC-36F09]MCP2045057.1 excisionase family DNA binding protein [Pontibacter sp. HSC-36F09]
MGKTYSSELHPRAGLVVEFDNQGSLLRYILHFFYEQLEEVGTDMMDRLTNEGIIKTVARASSGNEVVSRTFLLDCHELLVRLNLIDTPRSSNTLQLYTIQEVAKLLGVTRQTVYNIINAGLLQPVQLKGIKGQRIRKGDIDRYLDMK